MDEAKIEAMQEVVGSLTLTVETADRRGNRTIATAGDPISTELLRVATNGFRMLVDKAAAERAEPVAAEGEADVLTRFVEDLGNATNEASRCGRDRIYLGTGGGSYWFSLAEIGEVVRAINGLMNAHPTPPAAPAEPTIEECVAAINRAGYMGGGFDIAAVNKKTETWIDSLALEGVGRLLIDRERAAKGGA